MEKDSMEELIKEVENQANQAHGPNIYVIRALVPLIKSNAQVIEASESIKTAVEKFKKSTIKTEKWILVIALIGIIVAIAQFVLAFVTWRVQM